MSREWDEEEMCGKCAYNTYDKKEILKLEQEFLLLDL